jgi:hypothetical protein
VLIEIHHDVDHVASDRMPCAALDSHEFVLIDDARYNGVCF